MNQYQKEYAQFLEKFLAPQKKLKIVFDCSNGTTGNILKHLSASWRTKKLKAIFINEKLDGKFPAHGPNPLKPFAMSDLQFVVKKNKADLGVIFDADGDRAFFIDVKGRVVDPDIIASLLIWNLEVEKIVVTEITSSIISDMRHATGSVKIIRSQNGGYFIKNKMIENNADFGCERSGHYYFKINNTTDGMQKSQSKSVFYMDSGILAAIQIINAISKLPYKLSDFADLSLKYYRSGDINITYHKSKTTSNELFRKIAQKYKNQTVKISHIDGLRMDFKIPDEWWFNMQLSNTEPLLRLNLEALNKQTLAKQTRMLLGLLKNGV